MPEGELVGREPEDTDTQIEQKVLGLLTEAVQTLKAHSAKSDYQQTCGGMAIRSILDAVRSVGHMADRETRMAKVTTENGPQVGSPYGPRRFRVNVTVDRARTEWDPDVAKRHERPRYYDSGYAAANEARSYAMQIGNWVESVKVYDRLDHVLWTYDGEGDTAELREGDGTGR